MPIPVPGKNFNESSPIKSAFECWMLILGEENCLLFSYELFNSGTSLSPLNIARIFSYLKDIWWFELIWFYLSFGSSTASLSLLVFLASTFDLVSSISYIPAPLKSASLCYLFSSSCVTNSCWSSLNNMLVLSSSLR